MDKPKVVENEAQLGEPNAPLKIELVEPCLRVAEFASKQAELRQASEWKMAFGLWAVLAGGIVYGFDQMSWIFAAAVPVLHAFWLQSVWVRHRMDKRVAWNFVNEAQRILASNDMAQIEKPNFVKIGENLSDKPFYKYALGFLLDWSMRIQFAITALLTWLVISNSTNITWLTVTLNR